ncbi:MAG TPA: N-acetyltransferase [Syntrophobacteraceae bacterium]|jgi:putative acetyltransferase|nr:N-acetyltransferase [Syntrophobacteraceae bacterium]
MAEIRWAKIPGDLMAVKDLFQEYADSLSFELDFQDFSEELATLPGKYAPPLGSILVAKENGETVGCVAVRPLGDGICEMKRLFVQPAHRGRNLGRELALAIVEEAKRLGYKVMRLDTVVEMKEASALYRALGFQPIDAYCYNPLPGAMYFELKLAERKEQKAESKE